LLIDGDENEVPEIFGAEDIKAEHICS